MNNITYITACETYFRQLNVSEMSVTLGASLNMGGKC